MSGSIDAMLHQNGGGNTFLIQTDYLFSSRNCFVALVTVSRGGSLIRSWDPSSGLLLWESAAAGSQLRFNHINDAELLSVNSGLAVYNESIAD